jgi:hypothetical protein
MIYELRQYDINPDNWEQFREWGLTHAVPVLFEQFNLPLVGCFEPVPADDTEGESFNRTAGLHWILAWESIEERHRRMAELWASDEWRAAFHRTLGEDGRQLFFEGARITFLKAWPVSPMQ